MSEETTPLPPVPEDELSFDGSDLKDDGPVTTAAPSNDTKPKLDGEGKPIPEDRPEDYVGYKHPTGPNPMIDPISPVFMRRTAKPADDTYFISALPCDTDTFNSLVEAYPSINYDHGDAPREWTREVSRGASLMYEGSFLKDRPEQEGSQWCQRVPRGAGAGLGIMTPNMNKIGPSGPGTTLSGDIAAMRAQSVLGLGETRTIPLYHSGLWITMKAPSIAARLELQRRIGSEKVELGRRTDGLAYSNMSVYIKAYLADFAMAHVTSANVRYGQADELKSQILATDIPLILHGMLATMYPDGYAYHQPCMHDPSKCTHVVKEHIDLTKIIVTDRTRLTEGQLVRLEQRSTRATPEQLAEYRNAHYYVNDGKFELVGAKGNIAVQLKVPTIAEYIANGLAWVDGITNDIARAYGTDLVGERRNDYILERAKVTDMCEYSHWVKSLGMPDGAEIVEEEVIRRTLADISGIPEISTVFFTNVAKYMSRATIAMTALPKFDCPACGNPATPDEQKHPYLNPIDVEALFFMMLDQQIEKALTA